MQANRGADALSKFLAPLPLYSGGRSHDGRKHLEDAMRKSFLITAMLLLSAVWVVAQTTPSTPQSTTPGTGAPQSTSPSSTSPSQQPATPDTSSTTTQTTTTTSQTSTDSSSSIEGCLAGSAGNWTLTDQSGKAWQLAGDTSKLSDHVGHQVRVTGSEAGGAASSSSSPSSSAGAGASAGAGSATGAQPTFTVKKVKMISSSCPTSK
jgi:Protein of unknown function (DUF5818)